MSQFCSLSTMNTLYHRKRTDICRIICRYLSYTLSFALCLAILAGCASSTGYSAQALAIRQGFRETLFHTQRFTLYGLLRQGARGAENLHVYIEGDGRAWRSPTQPSDDPTPRNPVGLRLALADSGTESVLYLARPGQYVQKENRRNCAVRYWTSARLHEDVIAAMDEAVTQAKKRIGAQYVTLVGFSGGGGVAALLAARRKDVLFLGTVAGLLDTKVWTKLLGITPLSSSLNPLDQALSLQNLPQLHMSSPADATMPPAVSAGFCRAIGKPKCCVVVDGLEHGGAWQEVWNYKYATPASP